MDLNLFNPRLNLRKAAGNDAVADATCLPEAAFQFRCSGMLCQKKGLTKFWSAPNCSLPAQLICR
jgi:hypothetical protein